MEFDEEQNSENLQDGVEYLDFLDSERSNDTLSTVSPIYIDIRNRMSFQISPLLILTSAISLVGGTCQRSDQTPEVKVMNSTHLYISWETPFQGCDRERIQSAHVVIGYLDGDIQDIEVDFSASGIVVRANPCLSLSIRKGGCPKNLKRGAGGQNIKKLKRNLYLML